MMPEQTTTPGNDALAGALAYIDAGYYVGPVTITLRPDGKKDARFHTDWVRDPHGITDDPDRARAWAQQHPGCSWHAPCGPNEIVVVEGDVKGDESGVWNWRKAGGPSSPMKVTTRSGGEHWYFRAPGIDDPDGPIRNSAGRVPGIHAVDVRGDGGTVFIAGSVVLGGGGHYSTDAILPRDRLPQLTSHWARRLREAGARERVPELDDSTPQTHDRAWLETKTEQWFADIASGEQGGFRERLFAAAFFGFHAVEAGILERDEVLTRCYQAIRATWDHEPDDDDKEWLRDAWRKAQANPWTITEGVVESSPTVDNAVDATLAAEAVEPRIDDELSDEVRELTPAELAERAAARREKAINDKVAELELAAEARARVAAKSAPPLTLLGIDDFLARPRPVPLVDGLLYRNSLSRIFGAPGCGKSFVAIDLALRMALGWAWGGSAVKQAKVVYVMAEGDAVNNERAQAWMDRHQIKAEQLRGWFQAVPHKVLLLEEAVQPFIQAIKDQQIDLVILDTKNRMMIGNENHSEDNATMVRAVDAIREATGCCVLLIDHTGLNATGRAKGDNSTEGSMETEAEVRNDHQHPPKITVEVTRNKARVIGTTWEFFLRHHPIDIDGEVVPTAVLLPIGDDVVLPEARMSSKQAETAWLEYDGPIPVEVLSYDGGEAVTRAMPDLARLMAHDAGVADANRIGVSLSDAVRALSETALGKGRGHSRGTVRRAWSAIRDLGYIVPVEAERADDPEKVAKAMEEKTTGKHVWARR